MGKFQDSFLVKNQDCRRETEAEGAAAPSTRWRHVPEGLPVLQQGSE